MKFHKKTVISVALAVVLILSVALILVFKRLAETSPEKMLKILSDRVDLEVRNILYREVGGADSRWEIRAKKASYLKKDNQAFFEKLEVKVFADNGRFLLLAGDRGELNTETKNITVSGNVKVHSDKEERFETDYLEYSYVDKELHTEAAVLLQTPQMSVTGVGMTLSLQKRDLILLSRVHARIDRMSDRR